jgi:serine phosphatase RsbU (regulator of sigma subunit)
MGIVIADVADKGVPAALFMALSRTLLRTMAITGRSPASALALTNNLILADTRSELFVTVFYAILQPDTGDLAYVNAGHQPALLVRATGNAIEELRTGDMAMGVLPDPGYHEKTTHLDPGDILVLYTDGVVEASNAAEEQFGRRRLAHVTQEYRTAEAGELAAQIDAAVALFVGDAPRADDLTLVVLKRGAEAGRSPASGDPEAGA